jgi:hypothetical protein
VAAPSREDARDARPRERGQPADLTRGLRLPRGEARERVDGRKRSHTLNGKEVRLLATVGSFRVVPVQDLRPNHDASDTRHAGCRHLLEQGLLTTASITDATGSRHVAALTEEGRSLLESHRERAGREAEQAFYTGIIKPRELAHDAQMYRAFRAEADRIETDGGRVTRVVLDNEIKRDYQRFLNRDQPEGTADLDHDRRVFALSHDLSVVDGHLELLDLRIEYEDADGRHCHRDVEVVTEHYSRSQRAGKSRAGFVCYRAGGSARTGGTPFDPRHMERLR